MSASTFDEWGMPVVDKATMQSTLPNVFFGGDAAFGPKNIIWAVAHGHEAAVSIDKLLQRRGHRRAPAPARQPDVAEDGHPRVELRQRHLATTCATRCRGARRPQTLKSIKVEVELGFDAATAFKEAQRCLNCDVQTVFTDDALHRVRCLRGHLPDGLHHASPPTATRRTCARG